MTGDDIHWEDPPQPGREPGRVAAFVERLREHPGKWALYVTSNGNELGSTTTSARLKLLGAEVRVSTKDRDGTPLPRGRIRLYARWPEVES